MAPNGREPFFSELLAFNEVFNHDGPFQVIVGTGSYDVLGRSWAEVVFVNKDNPLTQLTMKQLDGIFGSERTGGFNGYQWSPASARTANNNIRKWGQLGLTGEWAHKTINTYGYAPTGMSNFFQLKVFGGGDHWNPNYREYVETGTKMMGDTSVSIQRMFTDLSQDKYGIGWGSIAHARNALYVKAIALSEREGGPYVACTKESVRNRTYPLTRSIFMQLDRAPGKPIEGKLKEFLRFILSREGQQEIARQGEYLPLTGKVAREELSKLE